MCVTHLYTRDHGGKYTVVSGADSGGFGPVFAILTVPDGSPRLILRWRRARVCCKVQILYFPINVMKCYEIPQNVMKNTKMLWNVMKLCYEIFHNIFITFCTVRKNLGWKVRKTSKNINFDTIKVKCMNFYDESRIGFFSSSPGMLWNPVPRKNGHFWTSGTRISALFIRFLDFHNIS